MAEYSVYLVERQGSQDGERQVTSPVGGTELDFYDSGVWLTRESGRNFFPYDEIRTIREHSEEEMIGSERPDSSETQSESAGDEQAERPGDTGAEEEMLE